MASSRERVHERAGAQLHTLADTKRNEHVPVRPASTGNPGGVLPAGRAALGSHARPPLSELTPRKRATSR